MGLSDMLINASEVKSSDSDPNSSNANTTPSPNPDSSCSSSQIRNDLSASCDVATQDWSPDASNSGSLSSSDTKAEMERSHERRAQSIPETATSTFFITARRSSAPPHDLGNKYVSLHKPRPAKLGQAKELLLKTLSERKFTPKTSRKNNFNPFDWVNETENQAKIDEEIRQHQDFISEIKAIRTIEQMKNYMNNGSLAKCFHASFPNNDTMSEMINRNIQSILNIGMGNYDTDSESEEDTFVEEAKPALSRRKLGYSKPTE